MIDESAPVSESVIFIANISVIGISVILDIGAPLVTGTCRVCMQIIKCKHCTTDN